MMRHLVGLILAFAVCGIAHAADDGQMLTTPHWTLTLPAHWQTQSGLLGAELVARPAASDAEAWANELLIVTREPYDPARSCLDGFMLRKLRDMQHLAQDFQLLDEVPLTLGDAVATRLELRYREGQRDLQTYLVIMATAGEMIVVQISSSPARFEFQRAQLRRIADSLRPVTHTAIAPQVCTRAA